MSAVLNGALIGDVVLSPGWNQILLAAPARAWRIGVNELVLSLSSSVSPSDARRRATTAANCRSPSIGSSSDRRVNALATAGLKAGTTTVT